MALPTTSSQFSRHNQPAITPAASLSAGQQTRVSTNLYNLFHNGRRVMVDHLNSTRSTPTSTTIHRLGGGFI